MIIRNIAVPKKSIAFLEKRNLLTQFQKALSKIRSGDVISVQLRKREPKEEGIYYFRINKQFRAYCTLQEKTLTVFHIDNHQ